MALEVGQRPVATVEPQGGPGGAEEIAAAGAAGRGAVGAGTAEDGQLHRQASTASTSGPRNREPRVRKMAGSPLVRNVRRASPSTTPGDTPEPPRGRRAPTASRTAATSKAVSSPDE